jgi:adenine-specific DNA-methyltransferase
VEWPTNEDAEQELRELFGARVFDYPKPVGLLQNLLNMCQFPSGDRILCLDFFAGSASLAEAVLKQSALDGTSRAFVLVQIPEKNEVSNRFATIADLTIARSRLAIKTHGSALPLEITHLKT